jgi:hypothetical protein
MTGADFFSRAGTKLAWTRPATRCTPTPPKGGHPGDGLMAPTLASSEAPGARRRNFPPSPSVARPVSLHGAAPFQA